VARSDARLSSLGGGVPPQNPEHDARDRRTHAIQDAAIRALDRSAERLVVFTLPGAHPDTGIGLLSGGVMSICAIAEETKRQPQIHGVEVILCTTPGVTPFVRHTLFPSTADVFRLEQVLEYFESLSSLTLHIPEYLAGTIVSLLDTSHVRRLSEIDHLHVNVMNQNIDVLPRPEELVDLHRIASSLTMTTAHARYCTEELSVRYGMPVHYLGVPIDVDLYPYRPYSEREDLALFSPDDPPKNDAVAGVLAAHFPRIETVVVQGIPYGEYRELLARARWTFAFGEGLDLYFVESVLGGGVAIAVFNDRFFTPEFALLDTVYASFEELQSRIISDIDRLSDPHAYEQYRGQELSFVSPICSLDAFRGNLESFIRGEYTWPVPAVRSVT
jgi:hypothetical protein